MSAKHEVITASTEIKVGCPSLAGKGKHRDLTEFRKCVCFVFAVLIFGVSPLRAGWAAHIVISEIATTGPNGAKDEFAELYNPTRTCCINVVAEIALHKI